MPPAPPVREICGHKAWRQGLARGLMVLTMALYVANDALVKYLGEALPLGGIITLRGLMVIAGMVLLLLLLPGHGPGAFRWIFQRTVLQRAAWDTMVTYFYLFALLHMPIANVLAIMNLSPLVILPLAAWRLGERVSARDGLAVAIGFTGALLVVRPGPEGFNPWALSALLAMLGVAGRDIATRELPAGASSLAVALSNVLFIQILALPLWLWQTGGAPALPTAGQWLLLAAAAIFLGAAYVLIVIVVRLAPLSATSAWRYSIVPWGVLAGWLVFGEWPDLLTWLGIGLIVAGSLHATRKET